MTEFNVGDVVEIVSSPSKMWVGFRAKVANVEPHGDLWLKPLTERPDGYKFLGFMWDAPSVKKVDSAKEAGLALAGDLVKISEILKNLELSPLDQLDLIRGVLKEAGL